MQNHPCTNLWVGWLKGKFPSNLTGESLKKYGPFWYTIEFDRACRNAGPLTRCMDWHKNYHVSKDPCWAPETCGCRPDTPARQAWRASTNPCS